MDVNGPEQAPMLMPGQPEPDSLTGKRDAAATPFALPHGRV